MIVLSGHFAIFSTCVGMTSNPITLLTTNPSLVYAYTGQYNDYLSLCQPALTVHNTSEELMDCFEDFFSQPGSIVQKVFPISATTIPREILEHLRMAEQYCDGMQRTKARMQINALIHDLQE